MDIFIDTHQYRGINEAKNKAYTASEKAGRIQESYFELKKRHDKMALACQALLEIVQDRLEVSDKEIEEKILEVDLRDGQADGKMGMQIVECSNCGRKTNTKRGSCFYCDTPTGDKNFFG